MADLSSLQRIAELVEAGVDLSYEQRCAAAAALRLALSRPASKLAKRNALLLQCRASFYSGRADNDAALEMEADWGRYAASTWRFDRLRDVCPENYIGTSRELFFEVLRLVDRPLTAGSIRRIFAHLR